MPRDEELTLRELLEDPIIELVMASDGVAREELAGLLANLRPLSRHAGSEPFETA
ncbi:hypothetical protein [Arenibaculum pallidiluteum]|uniref:hypothetical protein n=1 Tax=Arenibaculum pallidiluteum TaxID=2812559 RepID=UPI001A95F284|nr:hypothetical protein [Arenibaculum pallidiluteum]